MNDPLILAIECSDQQGSFALLRGERVLAHSSESLGKKLSQQIVPRIEAILAEGGATLADLDVIGVTVGPGSFTGLRVGLATVKGLVAAVPTIKVVGVGTLEALVLGIEEECLVGAALDARRGDVYAGLYRASGKPGRQRAIECIEEPAALASADWARQLATRGASVTLVGAGALANRDAMSGILGEGARFCSEESAIADARQVGELTRRAALAGDFADPESLTPSYVQVSQYARSDGTLG